MCQSKSFVPQDASVRAFDCSSSSSSRVTMVPGKELLPQASMGMPEARRKSCKTRCLWLVAGGQNRCQGRYEVRHPLVLSVTLSSAECLVQEQPDYFIISQEDRNPTSGFQDTIDNKNHSDFREAKYEKKVCLECAYVPGGGGARL